MKKLPDMYHNVSDKEFNNNTKVFSTINKSTNNNIDTKKIEDYQIKQKILNIFNSPNYIYKIDVTIITDKGKFNKRIVGKNNSNLITMDNEYIPINTIKDIYISK